MSENAEMFITYICMQVKKETILKKKDQKNWR